MPEALARCRQREMKRRLRWALGAEPEAVMPTSKRRRSGKIRPRGKPPRMPRWLPEEDEADDAPPPSPEELLNWQPHIRREPDPRQPSLPL